MTKYPTEQDDVLDFDSVIIHGDVKDSEKKDLGIVTYGNEVPHCLHSRN